MPTRHRLSYFALGGCLAAFLWTGASLTQEAQKVDPAVLKSQPVPESGQDTGKSRGANKSQQKKAPAENLTPSLNKIETAIRNLITQQRAAQSQGPKDNEIRDLKAQEGMARWAKAMFWATLAAVIVTLVGIVLIKKTLGETRRAATAAEGMLGEAAKTTMAAHASVRVAQESAEHQLRAYVHPISASLEMEESGRIIASLVFKNAGQTPAYKCECEYTLTFSHNLHSPGPADIEHVGDRKSVATIGPKGTFPGSIIRQGELIPEFLRMLADREIAIFVHGHITYRDVFKHDQITDFQYVYIGPWGGKKPLNVCEEGNDAS